MANAQETQANPRSATDLIKGRHSVRRFLADDVPDEIVRTILTDAARAPSGTNTQPWKVWCVTGAARDRVSHAARAAALAGEPCAEYPYMPSPLPEPYISRKRQVGYALYGLYGIARDDYPARTQAMLRNFEFFGAPVGLFFTMDRNLLHGSWLDCGMFMQNVMLLARDHGLETCPQQAWCVFGNVVHEAVGIPESEIILSGMAMGYADHDAPENTLVTDRIKLDEFATFSTI